MSTAEQFVEQRTPSEAETIRAGLAILRHMRDARGEPETTRHFEIWQAYNDAADRLDVLLSKLIERGKT